MCDADVQDRILVAALRTAGHDVQTANEMGLRTADDSTVLHAATATDRVLLTYNVKDFEELHREHPDHGGILGIYKHSTRRKNMCIPAIIRALANLEWTGWELRGQFNALNAWNY